MSEFVNQLCCFVYRLRTASRGFPHASLKRPVRPPKTPARRRESSAPDAATKNEKPPPRLKTQKTYRQKRQSPPLYYS
jgi:hypothetical protein